MSTADHIGGLAGAIIGTAGGGDTNAPADSTPPPSPPVRVLPDDPIAAALIELLQSPRQDVLGDIEALESRYPLLASKLRQLRAFLGRAFDMIPQEGLAGFQEVINLIQTNRGPVVPNIGDTI